MKKRMFSLKVTLFGLSLISVQLLTAATFDEARQACVEASTGPGGEFTLYCAKGKTYHDKWHIKHPFEEKTTYMQKWKELGKSSLKDCVNYFTNRNCRSWKYLFRYYKYAPTEDTSRQFCCASSQGIYVSKHCTSTKDGCPSGYDTATTGNKCVAATENASCLKAWEHGQFY